MTWSSSVIQKMRFGRNRVHFGSFTSSGGTTGGNIDTGMRLCDFLLGWQRKITAPTELIGVDEDFSAGPIPGNAITIVTEAAVVGFWIAVGR